MRFTVLDSPLGGLLAVRDDVGLTGLYLPTGGMSYRRTRPGGALTPTSTRSGGNLPSTSPAPGWTSS